MQYLTEAGVKLLTELSPELLNRASRQAGDDVDTLNDFAKKQIIYPVENRNQRS